MAQPFELSDVTQLVQQLVAVAVPQVLSSEPFQSPFSRLDYWYT